MQICILLDSVFCRVLDFSFHARHASVHALRVALCSSDANYRGTPMFAMFLLLFSYFLRRLVASFLWYCFFRAISCACFF